jgi:hypothetical protein
VLQIPVGVLFHSLTVHHRRAIAYW